MIFNTFKYFIFAVTVFFSLNACSEISSNSRHKMPTMQLIKNEKSFILPYFETSGSGEKVVIFLHGYGANRRSWEDISPYLSANLKPYYIDLIGFGKSPTPSDWPYTLEAQAKAVYNFLINENFSEIILVGHSYGGGVAMLLTLMMKDMKHTLNISSLILINPAIYQQDFPYFISLPRLPLLGPLLMACISPEYQVRTVLEGIFHNKEKVTKERVDRYVDNIAIENNRNAMVETAKHIVPKYYNDYITKIQTVNTQTLLIVSDRDPVIVKENLIKLNQILPNISLIEIANCGHVPQEEYPSLTAISINEFIGE